MSNVHIYYAQNLSSYLTQFLNHAKSEAVTFWREMMLNENHICVGKMQGLFKFQQVAHAGTTVF
jgi:hypothetical protein